MTKTSQDLPRCAPLCPLCGQANRCAPAASGSFDTPCWCTQVQFSEALLSRIPEALRGQACICQRCAEEARAPQNVVNTTGDPMSATQTLDFQIRKTDLSQTRLQTLAQPALQDGEVLLQVESFALTSNNITYAAFGDAMNYWGFYPVAPEAGEATSAWGRIPVWGFAKVSASRAEGIAVGDKFYGYYPMASSVVLTPARVSPSGFVEAAPHRAALAAVYNQYVRCNTDPFYTADSESLQSLLRPLFITSWLIDDFLADNAFFGTTASGQRPVMLLSSASSKTAYGTAFQLAQRAELDVVGLTSPGNVAFCDSLGCYSRVLTYDQLDQIVANTPMVYVDFAGNADLRRAVHTRFTALAYSSSIGGTHVSELGGNAKDLPGPRATLFFAPAQIKKRAAEWGGEGLGQRLVAAWKSFSARVSDPSSPWLVVEQHRGPEAVQAAYAQVLGGQGDPRVGHVLSMTVNADAHP